MRMSAERNWSSPPRRLPKRRNRKTQPDKKTAIPARVPSLFEKAKAALTPLWRKISGEDLWRKETAESVLNIDRPSPKRLTEGQKDAVIKAHNEGLGEMGKDGKNLAAIGNYTRDQIIRKGIILRHGGFSADETAILLKEGIAGVDGPQDSAAKQDMATSAPARNAEPPAAATADGNVQVKVVHSEQDVVGSLADFIAEVKRGMAAKERAEKAAKTDSAGSASRMFGNAVQWVRSALGLEPSGVPQGSRGRISLKSGNEFWYDPAQEQSLSDVVAHVSELIGTKNRTGHISSLEPFVGRGDIKTNGSLDVRDGGKLIEYKPIGMNVGPDERTNLAAIATKLNHEVIIDINGKTMSALPGDTAEDVDARYKARYYRPLSPEEQAAAKKVQDERRRAAEEKDVAAAQRLGAMRGDGRNRADLIEDLTSNKCAIERRSGAYGLHAGLAHLRSQYPGTPRRD